MATGRHRRPDGRRASPRPGRTSPCPRLGPAFGRGWDGRPAEYALLRLLVVGYRLEAQLPPPLRETVRSRIGFSLRQADVLAHGQPVRDHWQALARRDIEQERIRTRRTWLRGRKTGRPALVLSFAAAGLALEDSLIVGTDLDADLVFYPGAVPLRAVVLAKHDAIGGGPPDGDTIAGLLGFLRGRARRGPLAGHLAGRPARHPGPLPVPAVADADGDALRLHPGAGDCWPLLALSGAAW